jgi:RNA polymerase primary sigma factor
MASKTEVAPQKKEVPEKEGPETPPDSPLLDLSDVAIKNLVRSAKKRGYVTHDQINSLSKEVNSEQIEDILAMFSEMGINVVETEEAEADLLVIGRGAENGHLGRLRNHAYPIIRHSPCPVVSV